MIAPMTVAVWLHRRRGGGLALGRRRAAATLRAAFAIGWWWGFGYFLAGLWWLGAAFLVDADQFAWALPLGVVGAAAGSGVFPGPRLRARARVLVAGRRCAPLALGRRPDGVGIAARQCCSPAFPGTNIGMALGGASLAGAVRRPIVGLHGLTLLADRDLRRAGDAAFGLAADAFWRRVAAALAAAGFGALAGSPSRRRPPVDGREAAAHAAQCRARAGLFARERRGDPRRLSQALRPRDLARAQRRRRRHASVLAGIGVSVHPVATIAARWRASSISCAAARCSSPARRAPRRTAARRALFQFDPGDRPQRARRPSATTSTIWCRSANICRCARCSSVCVSRNSCMCPGGFDAGAGSRVLRVPGLARRARDDLLRGDLPQRDAGRASATPRTSATSST